MSSSFLQLPPQWRFPLLLTALFVVMQLLLFFDTTRSLVDTWAHSGTYNHGFIIAPISLWLIWTKRRSLACLAPRPAPLVLILYAAAGLAWLVADVLGILVVEQLALVSMLILGVWVLLGHRVAREIAFPLFFLYLAVPMGEGLVAPMMDFTADFTVKMLQLTGIPVYREGLFFSLPSGNWSVVEACSGVRYLIASVTLGLLYAYLTYQRLSKRVLFVIASFLVPVIANGLRAYMIVMIGHLSDMELAVGVDHLIYGWVFFGVVMFILFWIGSFWRDPLPAEPSVPSVDATPAAMRRRGWSLPVIALLAVALLLQTGQARLDAPGTRQLAQPLQLPQEIAGWQQTGTVPLGWRPHVTGTKHIWQTSYQQDGRLVTVFVALYPSQRQGSEAASGTNTIIDHEVPGLRVTHQGKKTVSIAGRPMEVRDFQVLGGAAGQRLVVWQWYLTGGQRSANPYLVKLQQLQGMIREGRRDGAYVAIAAPHTWGASADGEDLLKQFSSEAIPAIEQAVMQALGRGDG